jgi:hypothetical protein
LYHRMLYCWPRQAQRGAKGAFRFVRAFCREYFAGPSCYVCHRYPPSQAGLCDICYDIKWEVAQEMAEFGREE